MKKTALFLVIGIFALALGVLFNTMIMGPGDKVAAMPDTEILQRGTSFRGQEKALIDFHLVGEKGDSVTPDTLKGHWTFMFFGYTHCPDICPLTLQVMKHTLDALKEEVDAGEVRGMFVSVDPDRDSPEKLDQYTGYFHPAIDGATGEKTQIDALTRSLGIIYNKVENAKNPENYLVDHSAAILLINPEAEFAAVLSPPHEASIMATDFRALKAYHLEN